MTKVTGPESGKVRCNIDMENGFFHRVVAMMGAMAYVPLYFPGNSARRAVLIFLLFLEGTRWMLLLFAVIGVDALSPPVVSLDSMIWLACTVF